MKRMQWDGRRLLAGLVVGGCLALPARLTAQPAPTTVPPGTPVTITVTPTAASPPPVSITQGPRHGHVTPARTGCTHTGGGNIDVAQPSPDTLVVTMTGVAVAYGSCKVASAAMHYDLEQCLEINFDNPKVRKAKLTIEGRVIGLMRTPHAGGSAGYDSACATLSAGPVQVVTLCVPPHQVSGGENLSVNDHDGPLIVPISAGKYTLHQTFFVGASSPQCILPIKGTSAEFAPDPALDPLWISYKEPFHGAAKKDFGFQVTMKVAEDETPAEAKPEPKKGKKIETLPLPEPVGKQASIRMW